MLLRICLLRLDELLNSFQIVVFVALIAFASAARKVKRPIESYFSDFAGEEDIHLITGEDDTPPTQFVGDVMKAQTTSLKTLTGSKRFNYKYEFINLFLLFISIW